MYKMNFIAILCTFLWMWYTVMAKCVMHGNCAVVDGFVKMCPSDEEAPPVFDDSLTGETKIEILNILKSRCPELVYDEDGQEKNVTDIIACCDVAQLRDLQLNLLMVDGVLGRCPMCLRNFARQSCEMFCSPNQSKFLAVKVGYTPDAIPFVNEIDYKMHADFMVTTHTSCAGVIVPQTGTPAINLMCGNAPECTPEAWFGYMGDTSNNPLAPVQINFLKWPTPEDSMSARASLCNETLEGDLPCSCVDCHDNCPISERPDPPDICTVLSFNCIGFSVGIIFFALSVIIFTILTFLEYRRLKTSDKHEEKTDSNNNINVITKIFQKAFSVIGVFSASNPVLVIAITTWIAFIMLFGVAKLNLTANPMELWSGPETRTRQEFNFFNSRFGPFYRAAQVFLTFKGLESFVVNNVTYGPAFRVEAIHELVALENSILDIGRKDNTVILEDICYAPLRFPGDEPKLDQCVHMSVSTYLPDRKVNNDTYLRNIHDCLNNHFALNCLSDWGGGAEPEISVGGYEGDNILQAHTLIITFPIRNFLRAEDLVSVLAWEKKFINLMHEYEKNNKSDFVDVAFGTERSIEDEVQRISEAEALPITISYLLMFAYVIFALGNIRRFKTCLIDSKVMVAISCIIVVLISIFCSMGVLGYMNATLTLLGINVIPFFILSVGIDNVFLMINELHEVETNLNKFVDFKDNFSFEKKKRFIFGKMMNNIGPSIFVSSITQISCFAIGSVTNLPAVKSFAIFASLSLVFLFLFQITAVIGILSIDYKRVKSNRFDVLCCIKKNINNEESVHEGKAYQSFVKRLMSPYSKFILNWRVKITVAIIFMFLVSGSIIVIPQIEVGLDQEMALPSDSYVYKYVQSVNHLMRFGPPVFFVLKAGLNFTNPDHQNVICGSRLCNDDSLVTQVFLASRHSNTTYIARSSNSWIDDFFDWASLPNACCKYNTTDGGFCASMDNSPECSFCTIERSEFANGLRPSGSAFESYVPFFLQDTPTNLCNRGGLASYFSNVNFLLDSEGKATVYDTNFMAYHTNLVTSQDYTAALSNAYEISADITAAIQKHTNLDVEVFPYSVFYAFFEQYMSMWGDTFASLGYCLLGVLAINLFVTGFNFLITAALVFTVIMVVTEMMGVMYLWNIPLNPVSCINLIVSIGISVEFCSHIAYAYATSVCQPSEKVHYAIRNVGNTIITGITLTNIPIIVLYFSYTQIIEVFFFRMLFSLVILGCIHGMIFFPVLLSYLNDLKYR